MSRDLADNGGDVHHHPAKPLPRGQNAFNHYSPDVSIPSPAPGTFIFSDGAFSPQEPGRKRRRYGEDERRQVAETRKVGACGGHRTSKTKCTHDHECFAGTKSPPKVVERYLNKGERHEKIALGLTSNTEHIRDLKYEVERNMAAVNKSPTPKAETPAPKTGKSSNKASGRNMLGHYGSFKIARPTTPQNLPRPQQSIAPKGLMSPPPTHLGPPVYTPKPAMLGSTAMARGDSGYSYTSIDSGTSKIPSLVNSGFGGPPSVSYSPLQDPMPYTPTPAGKTLPIVIDPKAKPSARASAFTATAFGDSLPTSIAQANKGVLEAGLTDAVIFPEEDENADAFEFTKFLNDSYHVYEAFPEFSTMRSE